MDTISNMLTSIRNAQAVGHKTVEFPFSAIKYSILEILKEQGFITSFSKKGRGVKKDLEVGLKYKNDKFTIPFIQGLERISRSGQRIYLNSKELTRFSKERGIVIVSTSQGLMISKEARKKNIGGEIICKIW